MCLGLDYVDSAKLFITFPKTCSDLLILHPYFNLYPFICFVLYDPARSIK